jgi:hypothetical protein
MSHFLRQHAVVAGAIVATALIAPVAAQADGGLPVTGVPSVPALPAVGVPTIPVVTGATPDGKPAATVQGHGTAKCKAVAKALRARKHGKKPRRASCKVTITRQLATTVVKEMTVQRPAPVIDSGCLPGERLNLTGTVRDSFRMWTSDDGTLFVSDDHWFNAQGTGTNAAGQTIASYVANEANLSQTKMDVVTGAAMGQFIFNHHVIRQGETADGTYVNPVTGEVTHGDDLHEHSETHITFDPLSGNVDTKTNDYYYCG